MRLIINSRGKLEEVTYTAYERLMITLKSLKRASEKRTEKKIRWTEELNKKDDE